MTTRITFKSAVPPTPAEAAAAAATWERRGLLGRLVRLDTGRAAQRTSSAELLKAVYSLLSGPAR